MKVECGMNHAHSHAIVPRRAASPEGLDVRDLKGNACLCGGRFAILVNVDRYGRTPWGGPGGVLWRNVASLFENKASKTLTTVLVCIRLNSVSYPKTW